MMQAADLWDGDDFALRRRFDFSRDWGVSLQGLMCGFGKAVWVHPSFWCKPDFLLFIMDEYQVAVCRS
jgi:hypothetical protein